MRNNSQAKGRGVPAVAIPPRAVQRGTGDCLIFPTLTGGLARKAAGRCWLLLFLLAFANSPVIADANYYVGVKAGAYVPADSDYATLTSLGPLVGVNFPDFAKGVFSVEYAYLPALSGGDVKPDGRWSAHASVLSLAYRSLGPVFFKAQAGVLHGGKQDHNGATSSATDYGAAATFSAGFGLRLDARNCIEIEGIEFDSEVDLVTLGYNYRF